MDTCMCLFASIKFAWITQSIKHELICRNCYITWCPFCLILRLNNLTLVSFCPELPWVATVLVNSCCVAVGLLETGYCVLQSKLPCAAIKTSSHVFVHGPSPALHHARSRCWWGRILRFPADRMPSGCWLSTARKSSSFGRMWHFRWFRGCIYLNWLGSWPIKVMLGYMWYYRPLRTLGHQYAPYGWRGRVVATIRCVHIVSMAAWL